MEMQGLEGVQGQGEGEQGLQPKAKEQGQLPKEEEQMQKQEQPLVWEQGLNVILVGGQNELEVQGPHGGLG